MRATPNAASETGAPRTDPDYSVVVPVFESAETLTELVCRLRRVFESTLGSSYEVILVDDGSRSPQTWQTCQRLAREGNHVTAVRLMRNYGKAAAILCGLEHARGRWIVTLDDDLQHRPEDIPTLAERRDHDVVVAQFERRRHSFLTISTSWVKGHFDRLILDLPCRMSPFKLFKAEVARGMLQVRTPHPFIPALMAHSTTDFVPVQVPHEASKHGASRYTLRRRLGQFSNLLVSNSSLLLRWFGGFGFVFSVTGFAFAAMVLARKLFSSSPPLPGWASLVVLHLVFGGLILIALAIVGEYLIRILEGIGQKPTYLVREVDGERRPE